MYKEAVKITCEKMYELKKRIKKLEKLQNSNNLLEGASYKIEKQINDTNALLNETTVQLDIITYVICKKAETILLSESNAEKAEIKAKRTNPFHFISKRNWLSNMKISGVLAGSYGNIAGFVAQRLDDIKGTYSTKELETRCMELQKYWSDTELAKQEKAVILKNVRKGLKAVIKLKKSERGNDSKNNDDDSGDEQEDDDNYRE